MKNFKKNLTQEQQDLYIEKNQKVILKEFGELKDDSEFIWGLKILISNEITFLSAVETTLKRIEEEESSKSNRTMIEQIHLQIFKIKSFNNFEKLLQELFQMIISKIPKMKENNLFDLIPIMIQYSSNKDSYIEKLVKMNKTPKILIPILNLLSEIEFNEKKFGKDIRNEIKDTIKGVDDLDNVLFLKILFHFIEKYENVEYIDLIEYFFKHEQQLNSYFMIELSFKNSKKLFKLIKNYIQQYKGEYKEFHYILILLASNHPLFKYEAYELLDQMKTLIQFDSLFKSEYFEKVLFNYFQEYPNVELVTNMLSKLFQYHFNLDSLKYLLNLSLNYNKVNLLIDQIKHHKILLRNRDYIQYIQDWFHYLTLIQFDQFKILFSAFHPLIKIDETFQSFLILYSQKLYNQRNYRLHSIYILFQLLPYDSSNFKTLRNSIEYQNLKDHFYIFLKELLVENRLSSINDEIYEFLTQEWSKSLLNNTFSFRNNGEPFELIFQCLFYLYLIDNTKYCHFFKTININSIDLSLINSQKFKILNYIYESFSLKEKSQIYMEMSIFFSELFNYNRTDSFLTLDLFLSIKNPSIYQIHYFFSFLILKKIPFEKISSYPLFDIMNELNNFQLRKEFIKFESNIGKKVKSVDNEIITNLKLAFIQYLSTYEGDLVEKLNQTFSKNFTKETLSLEVTNILTSTQIHELSAHYMIPFIKIIQRIDPDKESDECQEICEKILELLYNLEIKTGNLLIMVEFLFQYSNKKLKISQQIMENQKFTYAKKVNSPFRVIHLNFIISLIPDSSLKDVTKIITIDYFRYLLTVSTSQIIKQMVRFGLAIIEKMMASMDEIKYHEHFCIMLSNLLQDQGSILNEKVQKFGYQYSKLLKECESLTMQYKENYESTKNPIFQKLSRVDIELLDQTEEQPSLKRKIIGSKTARKKRAHKNKWVEENISEEKNKDDNFEDLDEFIDPE